MPTPSPMSRISWPENCGILSTWLSRETTATAVPSDTSAVMSGSAVARSDPNTKNNTTAAATIPRPVPPSP